MTIQEKPLNEVTKEALEVLSKEIGIADTIRFLNQFTSGYGNYVEEKELMFGKMSLDELVAEIGKTEKPSGS